MTIKELKNILNTADDEKREISEKSFFDTLADFIYSENFDELYYTELWDYDNSYSNDIERYNELCTTNKDIFLTMINRNRKEI